MFSSRHCIFRRLDLLEPASHMHRAGTAARRVGPGDRLGQGPVELEHPGAVAVTLKTLAITWGQVAAGDGEELPRCDIEEIDACIAQLIHRGHTLPAYDLAAKTLEVRYERVRELLRAPAHNGPAHRMCGHGKDQGQRRRERCLQALDGVRCHAGQQSAGAVLAKCSTDKPGRRPYRAQPKTRQGNWMGGQVQRGVSVCHQHLPVGYERCNQSTVVGAIATESRYCRVKGALDNTRIAPVQRVGHRQLWLHELGAQRQKIKLAKEGRNRRHRMDSGAGVVDEARSRELG